MVSTTTALLVSKPGEPFDIREVQLDNLQPDEILVKMVATGICHTDISSAHGLLPPKLPAVLGHEGAGIVEKVGSQVYHLAVDDHVVLSIPSCGACARCVSQRPSYCRHGAQLTFGGARLDGSKTMSLSGSNEESSSTIISSPFFGQSSFAARSVVNARCAVKVSAELPLEILCPLGCGLSTGVGTVLNDLKPFVGCSIAVFGVGTVGLAAIMAAANFTPATKIVAVDVVESRLALAKRLGATHTVNSKNEDLRNAILKLTDGDGVDRALDATGKIAVIETKIASAANNGIVATVGGATFGEYIKIEPASWIGRGVNYVGSCLGSSNPQTLIPALVEMWKQGRFPIEDLGKKYSYKDVNQAVEHMHGGACVKPVLIWD